MKAYIGIDNGVTASIAFILENGKAEIGQMPTVKQQNYTKAKQGITRIDTKRFYAWLLEVIGMVEQESQSMNQAGQFMVIIERPMINPMRFKNSISAARALEAVLVTIESLNLPHCYIDSRVWQKELLPEGLQGPELKTASNDIGRRLFPQIPDGKKGTDKDALLIAEFARRKQL